jgi:predicted PurR-regulated permease PerM
VAENQSSLNFRHATLIATAVVIAGLYFAREVLIPFALALLLAFVLTPPVNRLRRWHFGPVPSVVSVVVLAIAILAVIGGLVTVQLTDLARQLPRYEQNIHRKLDSIRVSSSSTVTRLSRAIREIRQEWSGPAAPARASPDEQTPVPVEIQGGAFSLLDIVRNILGSLIHLLLLAAVVVVLVIFFLLEREDLRDRLIRLVGVGELNLTTRALDEAAGRVSRYLLAQLGLNTAYGLCAGIGLHFLHVPNPALWGVLAALFRYVPYLGIWIAATMPAAVALAVSPGWLGPLAIFALYFGLDLLMYNFAEPFVYGSSTGLTPVSILVAAVFWTWLWGPLGLLLSTPLTVCLVVVGHHVPRLEYLRILLSDEPALSPDKRLYQRLLAGNEVEALRVAEEFLKDKPLEELYQQVILPALILAQRDRRRAKLGERRHRLVLESARALVAELAERADARTARGSESGKPPEPDAAPARRPPDPGVLCLPADGGPDEIGALMLSSLLQQQGLSARTVSPAGLESRPIDELRQDETELCCVSVVPPGGDRDARRLCKTLRAGYPHLKIVAAILNPREGAGLGEPDAGIAADAVATTFHQAVQEILALAPERVAPSGKN